MLAFFYIVFFVCIEAFCPGRFPYAVEEPTPSHHIVCGIDDIASVFRAACFIGAEIVADKTVERQVLLLEFF